MSGSTAQRDVPEPSTGGTGSPAAQHTDAERVTRRMGVGLVVLVTLMPVLLAVGWSVSASIQVDAYDWTAQTISVLAGRGATDRWIMVVPLVVAGAVYVVLALRLDGLVAPCRALLMVAGLAVAVAGLAPQPVHGSSTIHMSAAACAWIALTLWPLTVKPRPGAGFEAPPFRAAATAVLLVLMGWFFVELVTDGALLGAVERLLILAQLAYPTVVAYRQGRSWTERLGSDVTHDATVELHGVAELGAPVMQLEFEKLGRQTVDGIQRELGAPDS
ncbi:DUF998 domain-containing protein [Pseudonocardia sp. N23]|uniref:DUF998 domain-containing protein n=1 Tax=Pseudonocardia sp. N23 TaxID=1987376 RepID=UPI000BFE46C1|nr:DUF998 domain-containing protein [Pseudonocardia sp. N23]GAY07587.1 putative integral membrane protein [Pseudonocardia sp. N23]